MEIHLPRPITSLKDFFRELLTITAGILIALSLEGLIQWHHHRELAHEAKANIVSELRENQRELTGEEQSLRKMQQDVETITNLAHQFEEKKEPLQGEVRWNWNIAELHSTSWETARSTGALTYMPYSEVKRYSEVYDLQRTFEELQQKALASSVDLQVVVGLFGRKMVSSSDLSDAERRLATAMANVIGMQQIAQALSQRYEQTLQTTRER